MKPLIFFFVFLATTCFVQADIFKIKFAVANLNEETKANFTITLKGENINKNFTFENELIVDQSAIDFEIELPHQIEELEIFYLTETNKALSFLYLHSEDKNENLVAFTIFKELEVGKTHTFINDKKNPKKIKF